MVLPEVSPVGRTDLRRAIAVIIRRSHAGATRAEWPEIALAIAKQLATDPRIVRDVLERVADGAAAPEKNRPGQGRPLRIQPGTVECDRLVNGLLSRFGARHTASFIDALPGN